MSKNTPEKKSIYYSPDNKLYEMTLDKAKNKSQFVSNKDGTETYVDKIEMYEPENIMPLDPSDDRLKYGFIKFPSRPIEYGTEEELYLDVKNFIDKNVYLPEEFLHIASCYVLMSWLYDQFQIIPYLRVIGDFGTGKSRFLDAVGNICYKPMNFGGSASTSSIFRTIHNLQGTMLFDEADFRQSETFSEIVKLLNSGHKKGGSVQRMQATANKDDFNMKIFYVFGPKIIASRERFSDEALESRCLTHYMISHKESERPVHLPNDFEDQALVLRNKLLMFRLQNYEKIKTDESLINQLTIPRIKQTMLALTAVAKLVGDEVLKSIIVFAKNYELDLMTIQTVSYEADIITCLARLIKIKPKKIYMRDVSKEYNSEFGSGSISDYERPMQQLDISPRKAGDLINKKLHIRTARDSEGIYIPVEQEFKRIESICSRYGITEKTIAVINEEKEENTLTDNTDNLDSQSEKIKTDDADKNVYEDLSL